MNNPDTDRHTIDRHLISCDASLRDALRQLNDLSGGNMTLFVTDSNGIAVGSLTDGDARRALVADASLDSPVSDVMHRDFCTVPAACPDVAELRRLRRRGIMLVPLIDDDGHITDIIDLSHGRTLLPMSAVLMAGGKGERLRPLTLDTPKPLLPVGGKAIIDYNIEALAACGITDITVTVRYLAHLMHRHFSEPVSGVHVKCVEEDRPLGTIGSARLAALPPRGLTIVMNSDLLTNIDFEDMYLHHLASGADISMAVIPYQVSVPYAIVETDDDGFVTSLAEKPVYPYSANAGIYIIPNRLMRDLPDDAPTDAPDLICRAIEAGMKVCQYPITGTWIDIGTPTDYHRANELTYYTAKRN